MRHMTVRGVLLYCLHFASMRRIIEASGEAHQNEET